MKGTIDKLDNGLKKGVTKIDIGKGVGASLTKSIEKFRDEYANLSKLTEGNSIKFGDSKEAIQSGERLVKLYKEIHSQTGRLQNLSGLDLKKIFPDAFDSRVSTLQNQMQSLQNIFLQIGEKELKLKIADDELQASRTQLKELSDSLIDTTAKQEAFNKAQAEAAAAKLDLEAQEQSAREAGQALEGAKQALEELRESFRQQINLNLGKIDTEIKGLEESLEDLRKKKAELEASGDTKGAAAIGKQITSTESAIKTKTAERKKVSTAASKIQTADPKKLAEFASATTSDLAAQTAALEKAQQAYGNYTAAQKAADTASGQAALARKEHTAAMDREQDALEDLQAAEKSNTNTTKQIENVTKKIEEQENAVATLTTQIEGLKTKLSTKGAADLKELIPDFSEESLKTQEGVDGIIRKLQELDDQRATELIAELQKIDTDAEDVVDSVEQMRQKLDQVDEGAKDIKRTGQEIENLKNQVLQFFSLTNAVQLFRRAVTKALNTVKELDKTMTEAAVVTDFSVGDMWEKLPEYSANAQKLGVSINSMYQATTLYYQQGLKTNEAMQLGIETMKMAKIAGMDSTEATKAMTAALRGFNMELNETSATKVNDVYSQLAAVTAADTSQIATAMEKTASIAASANMEFETTAALLAQIIETTQEAPETAGTAMKTIIARFAEVKSLRDQGLTTGQDEEGEGIDVNKIQTALRSVGISMEGFFSGTEGLDSILLKLSEKWGTLDFETQRYIATMAAGSRQQSRFIAMMSDYSRTTELVGQAQNSAGASQKQFEKTQDSLEAKLQKLSNAWDEFLMGLSNNEIIKGAVDFLTFVIEGVNKLTEALSGGNGLTKSIISLMTVIGALKLGRNVLGGIMGKVGGSLGLGQQGPTQETITETGPDGQQTVKTIVKEPYKEGQQSGQQAGQGFVAGFKNAIAAKKDGGSALKGFFTSGENGQIIDGKFRGGKTPLTKKGKEQRAQRQKAVDQEKDIFMSSVREKNKGNESFDDAALDKAGAVYDEIIQKGGSAKDAADGANASLKEMGVELGTAGENAEQTSLGLQGATLNMGALGGAAMAVGGSLGLLASLFESLGMEEEAEAVGVLAAVFMGLGTVMTTLSSIAPMLGMSFTTAGVQITTAGVTSQLAWWWVFLIIAAVAALIALVVVLAKVAQENSLEGRMEAAAEATENAKAAAEEAKKAYEDLLNAKEGYDELQTSLNDLTKGTKEWKEALMESNQQVLELLTTYPQLAQYLGRGEHGQLTISEEGWDKVIDQQAQSVKNASVAVLSSQMSETRLKQEQAEKNLNTAAYNAGITRIVQQGDYSYVETDKADVAAIQQAYAENGEELFKLDSDGSYSTALEEFAKSIGQTADEIYKLKDAIGAYDVAMAESDAVLQGQAEAMLAAGVTQETLDYEYSEDVMASMAEGVVHGQQQAEKDIAGKLYSKDGSSEAQNNEYFQQLMAENGLTSNDMTGDDAHDLEVLYAKMAGIEVDQVADGLKGNKEKLAAEIAKIQAGKDAAAKTDAVTQNFKKLDKDTQRLYAIASSKDASKGTREDIQKMANINMEQYAKTMGFEATADKSAAQQLAESRGYTDKTDANGNVITAAAQMEAEMKGLSESISVEFDKVKTKAKKLGLSETILDASYLKKATATQLDAYVDLMGQAQASGADLLSSSFGQLMKAATETQQQQILNAMGSFDFTKEGEAEQFMLFLESIGVNLPTDQAKLFTKELKKIGEGFRKIDATALKEAISSLLDLADQLDTREDSEGLTQEERDQLIDRGIASKNDFMWTGQSWQYLAGPLKDLAEALRENTAELMEKDPEILRKQVAKGEQTKALIDGATKSGDNLIIKGKTFNAEQFLGGTLDENSKEDLRAIFGLSGNATGAEIMDYYKSAINDYNNLTTNKNSLEQINYMTDVTSGPMNMEYQGLGVGVVQTTTNVPRPRALVYDPDAPIAYNGKDMLSRRPINFSEVKETEVITGGPTQQQQKQLTAMAKAYGVSQTAIDKFTEGIKSSDLATRQAALSTFKNAIELKKQEKQYGKTMTRLQDVAKNYSTVEKGMSGYDEAISSFGEALNLDMTDVENWAFVVDNMELIKEAAEGNINSIYELNRLLAQEHGFVISADGNFDLYNSKVDLANQVTQDFLQSQYEAGSMRLVEITAESEQQYIVPDGSGGFKLEKVQAGQVIQVLQPADKASIERSIESSGASSSKPEPIENPYDKLYNGLEEINDLLRERERLERQYQRLVRKGVNNVNELRKSQQDQLASLREENEKQKVLIASRYDQIDESISKNSAMSKYVQIETLPNGDRSVRIDWEKINQVYQSGDEKETEKIQKFLDENKEWLEDIYDREATIEENLDKEYELLQQGKDEYLSIEEQIKSAIEASAQKEIDRLSAINDSINDTNSKILESMQEQIDTYRQNRENEKTEEELADKLRRLAYLQQDTSGANAAEILALQKELDEGKESYTDQLIDQKISELQKQNDKAAEQRQEQIDIAQAQLQHYLDSKEVWDEVDRLLQGAINEDGSINSDSELIRLLKETNGYDAMSQIGQMSWYKDLLSTLATGFNWLSGDGVLSSFWEGQQIEFTTADGKTVKGTVNANGTVTAEDGQVYSNVRWNGGDNFSTDESFRAKESKPVAETPQLTEEIKKGVSKAIWNRKDKGGWGNDPERRNKLREVFGENDIQAKYISKQITAGNPADYTYEKMRMKFKGYKTGGLADFTGPAWLDGTKSKPEYILNADQTKAFFTLVDVLSGLQTNTSKSSEKTGDNTYDIDINVESIGSDYDVEQLAEKVKSIINDTARYRNNNAISRMR